MASWKEQSLVRKVIYAILIAALAAAIVGLCYVITAPGVQEKFTEFYILGAEGKTEGYPAKLVLGETATVIVGIVNHEHEDTSYHVEVRIDSIRHYEIGPLVLGHEGKWEREVSFTMDNVSERQKVEFVLYKEGKQYATLYLWINVIS